MRVRELWDLANNAGALDEHCACVADIIERLYKSGFSECPKYDALKQRLIKSDGRKIAVVVPKAYYIDILKADESINGQNVTFVTANRFDNSQQYDEIIVVGDFIGKRFDPLKCRAASEITVLLYECETHSFNYKKRRAVNFERKLNLKLDIIEDDFLEYENSADDNIDCEYKAGFAEVATDLEQYIERISTFDIGKFVAGASGSTGSTLTSEICAVGRFVSGEQILFSKYYTAVVFDAIKGTVSETDVEGLATGDMLVFVKRDDYTRNMVDYIYESLQTSGRLSAEVLEATAKASYWKEALQEFKNFHGLSYRDIAKELQKLGGSLQEVSIRQWLIEESHIVGPREEKTLAQIAELTQDSYLLGDTHGYFEACRTVRRQRKEILVLIGKAITDKLIGHEPPIGSMLEVVYDNVENLSETLELEGFSMLDEPVAVPINICNKPITEWEEVSWA
ncbi:MAG: DrmE family protein [Firmicutes bacterium]|nr:DrmE family protein [Bacillota bacterium]